mmetsp:Transcript_115637/g.360173  ORF Transcript_115637/g.360173 Transcript_115637/m.360173 type:complete len:118 (+) Transcript_115637:116-469(+)
MGKGGSKHAATDKAKDILSSMDPDTKGSYKEVAAKVFADFDKDGSGKLEKQELKGLIEKLSEKVYDGWKAKQPDLDEGFKGQLAEMMTFELDSDFSGDVTKEEFTANIEKIVKEHGA